MKKIIITLLIVIINLLKVFALENNLLLDSSNNKLSIGENTKITIKLKDLGSEEFNNLKIDGIEGNFDKLGESSFSEFKFLNGIQSSIYTIEINLKAKKEGEFKLIAKTNKKNVNLESNSITISVNKGSISRNNLFENNTKITKLNEIKENKNYLGINFNFIFYFLGIILLIGFYFALNNYFFNRNKENIEKDVEKNKVNYFLEKIKEIEKEKINSTKSEFYGSINELIREFLENKGIKNASKMSYLELSNYENDLLYNKIITIFKETYEKEFRDFNDSFEEKSNIIDKLKKEFE